MSNVFRDAMERITGTSWLDDAARMSLEAAERKFGEVPRDTTEAARVGMSKAYVDVPSGWSSPVELTSPASTHYGLMVVPLGDDGDVALILGHHDMRRTVAALNQYSRTVDGLLNMFDDLSMGYADAVADIEYRWAKLVTECDGTDRFWHSEGCDLCTMIRSSYDDGTFWVQYDYDQDEPGVFPVMVWHA